ncbi:MAG: DNA-binding response OmpR family regulator [Flavobacterium sp.]|jgi:DNA-binding response OmpR family regulator
MKKILLVEDDLDLARMACQILELQNYNVTMVHDGNAALKILNNQTFDLCILDVMMPNLDGFSVAKKMIKQKIEVPFLFVTAKSLKKDKLEGLKLGAEDYITKPFDTEEVLLRIENILRRNSTKYIPDKINIANYELDCQRLVLHIENQQQQLTEKEAALLLFLNANPNRLIKRDEILEAVWQTTDFFSGRSMDVYLSKLRKHFANNELVKIESTRHVGLEFKIQAVLTDKN